ncbi:MAG: hypothetical protein K5978_07615 [Campylobacter sp.]|nr:hypothetical protein [Campylobacter sp.]
MIKSSYSVIISVFIIMFCWFFLETNSSYQLAFKARFYQSVGNYEEALKTSQEALQIDPYNKMAMAVQAKSKKAAPLNKYIKTGEEYLETIRKMSESEVDKADNARIKLMCEIMIQDYDTIANIKVDDELEENAKKTRDNFEKLFNELFVK